MQPLLVVLYAVFTFGASSVAAQSRPACSIAQQGLSVLTQDCSLASSPLTGPLHIAIRGAYGSDVSPAVLPRGAAPTVEVATLQDFGLAAGGRVVLQHLLVSLPTVPTPLPVPTNTSLQLEDIRFIVTNATNIPSIASRYWQAVATLPTVPPVYTDNATFLHLNVGARLGWTIAARSVSVLAAPTNERGLQPQRNGSRESGASVNYILSATNDTLVPQLLAHAGRVTREPLIVYVTSNVTLAWGVQANSSKLPPQGIPVNRPVIFVGSPLVNTSIDFRMDVNQLNLVDGNSPYGSVTFDSLVLENLGPGDARSHQYANGASLSVTTVMWPVLFKRQIDVRVTTRNCTVVVSSAAELDWLSYWAAAWNSPLPYFQMETAWLKVRNTVSSWLIDPTKTTPRSFAYINATGVSADIYDSVLTLDHVVASPVALPPPDTLRPPLTQVTAAAPLVIYCPNATILLTLVSRPPFNPQRPRFLVVGDGSLQQRPTPQRMELAGAARNLSTGSVGAPFTPLPVVFPLTITGVPDNATLLNPSSAFILSFNHTRDILRIPDGAQPKHLELAVLQLSQLPQGPGAQAANRLVPDVFTMLMWSIQRPMGGNGVLVMTNVSLLLPGPELRYVHARARTDRVFSIRTAGGAADVVAITGARVVNSNMVHVDTMMGYGVSATNITFALDANGADVQGPSMPYYWPSDVSDFSPGSQLPGWAIAVIVLGAVFAALAVGLLVRRRYARSKGLSRKAVVSTKVNGEQWHGSDMEVGSLDSDGVAAGKPLPGSSQPGGAVDPAWRHLHSSISAVSRDLAARRAEAVPMSGNNPLAGAHMQNKANGASNSNIASSSPASSVGRATPSTNMASINGSVVGLKLQLYELLGSGNFASVYRGVWRGTPVAVKVMQLPAASLSSLQQGMLKQQTGQQQQDAAASLPPALRTRENMAVNEAAISTTVSHPNIVQVYTYTIKPSSLQSGSGQQGSGAASLDGAPQSTDTVEQPMSWELCLVMEYCDQGTLRSALDGQRFQDPATGRPHHTTVMALALDVACAMLHLHSEGILHGDLKTSNVLLKQAPVVLAPAAQLWMSTAATQLSVTSPGGATLGSVPGARLVAKVADFGLSTTLDPNATHLSHVHAGTLSHMAPELLEHGRASRASDVYAFGILMWELATGGRPFAGTPRALLGHQIVHARTRPLFPVVPRSPFSKAADADSELAYQQLAQQCWAHEPCDRPTFGEVVAQISALLQVSMQQPVHDGQHGDWQHPQAQPQQQQQAEHHGELTQTGAPTNFGTDATECSSWAHDAAAVLPFFNAVPLRPSQVAGPAVAAAPEEPAGASPAPVVNSDAATGS